MKKLTLLFCLLGILESSAFSLPSVLSVEAKGKDLSVRIQWDDRGSVDSYLVPAGQDIFSPGCEELMQGYFIKFFGEDIPSFWQLWFGTGSALYEIGDIHAFDRKQGKERKTYE